MSDPTERMFQVAYLLGVDLQEVRAAVSQARHAYPNEDDDSLLASAAEALNRTRQKRALDRARESIGR
jgi:hypothetical protein